MTHETTRPPGDRAREATNTPDGHELDDFKPMTAQEAAAWRQRQKPVSIMTALLWQLGAGVVAVVMAWVLFPARTSLAVSALYGVCAVWVPAWLCARAMLRQQRQRMHALGALSALMLWEGIKIVLTIALLAAAPRVVKDLSWLALLTGFVVTVKAAWFGWWWQMRPRRPVQDY